MPPRDQPISVPTMDTGPQWTNMPKRRSFQRSRAALGAPGSAGPAPDWAISGTAAAAATGRVQKFRLVMEGEFHAPGSVYAKPQSLSSAYFGLIVSDSACYKHSCLLY